MAIQPKPSCVHAENRHEPSSPSRRQNNMYISCDSNSTDTQQRPSMCIWCLLANVAAAVNLLLWQVWPMPLSPGQLYSAHCSSNETPGEHMQMCSCITSSTKLRQVQCPTGQSVLPHTYSDTKACVVSNVLIDNVVGL